MRPELNRATGMLFRAGVKHITIPDCEILAADIVGVAAELAGETGDPAFHIADAARTLENRVGLANIPAYVRLLRKGPSQPKERVT